MSIEQKIITVVHSNLVIPESDLINKFTKNWIVKQISTTTIGEKNDKVAITLLLEKNSEMKKENPALGL